jgi:hypothetical protein
MGMNLYVDACDDDAACLDAAAHILEQQFARKFDKVHSPVKGSRKGDTTPLELEGVGDV